MPPKRKAATPPPKKTGKAKVGQTSIDNFFSSPSKQRNGNGNGQIPKRETSVISIADSDDDLPLSATADETIARELQDRYDVEVLSKDKGKAKLLELADADDEDDGIEIIQEEVNVKQEGINGSSSSKVHPMFAPAPSRVKTPPKDIKPKLESSPPLVEVKPELKGSPAKITTNSAEAVEPIDFNVDQFIFRPGDVDVSRWPKGRLPYSVLVGVYVQVSSTRSRLLIVRVLTK
jgi:DNA ligase-1